MESGFICSFAYEIVPGLFIFVFLLKKIESIHTGQILEHIKNYSVRSLFPFHDTDLSSSHYHLGLGTTIRSFCLSFEGFGGHL